MKKLISSILMVTGTTIGGGMVMLPSILGIYGYFSAISMLAIVWLFNTVIALIFLEANCYLPMKTSLISMSKRLLGKYAEWITWVICLSFLYTIMCVYISGITEVISGFLDKSAFHISSHYLSLLSVMFVSIPIYFGMNHVNALNKAFVGIMLVALAGILFFILPHTTIGTISTVPSSLPIMALPIVFTSFGFLIVIPSLRSYLEDDIKKIKVAIIIGSLIPLVIYTLWTTAVMSVVPSLGHDGLQMVLTQGEPVKSMTSLLVTYAGSTLVALFMKIFILFAIASSFIGISLGLFDFLADGFNINKSSVGKVKLLILTFLPPLVIAITQNRLFLTALGFAGLISTILFGIYPLILTYSGRYIRKLDTVYRISVGWPVFLLILIFCILIIGIELSTI